ncbi:hypothetical protein BH20ACI3_BH20ACI3_39170 [soil metagenome]
MKYILLIQILMRRSGSPPGSPEQGIGTVEVLTGERGRVAAEGLGLQELWRALRAEVWFSRRINLLIT